MPVCVALSSRCGPIRGLQRFRRRLQSTGAGIVWTAGRWTALSRILFRSFSGHLQNRHAAGRQHYNDGPSWCVLIRGSRSARRCFSTPARARMSGRRRREPRAPASTSPTIASDTKLSLSYYDITYHDRIALPASGADLNLVLQRAAFPGPHRPLAHRSGPRRAAGDQSLGRERYEHAISYSRERRESAGDVSTSRALRWPHG